LPFGISSAPENVSIGYRSRIPGDRRPLSRFPTAAFDLGIKLARQSQKQLMAGAISD
jgi:hypothetical protein